MNGQVDRSGRALLSIVIRSSDDEESADCETWIDTGFTGELVLPKSMIERLGLRPSGTVSAILADGSQVAMLTYGCSIEWFGEQRSLEVVANDGESPLLGVGLLLDHVLQIDYRNGSISLE